MKACLHDLLRHVALGQLQLQLKDLAGSHLASGTEYLLHFEWREGVGL